MEINIIFFEVIMHYLELLFKGVLAYRLSMTLLSLSRTSFAIVAKFLF